MDEGLIIQRVTVLPFMENVYIVGDPEGRDCFVIDPGAEAERIIHELNEQRLTLQLILNTHGHLDHTGAIAALKEFTGVPYALHPADIGTLELSRVHGPQMVPNWRAPPDPEMELIQGDEVKVGRFTFSVLETPGHTPGGISLYGHGVVFTGDTLFQGSVGRVDLPGGDGQALIRSIHVQLLTLPDETRVYPGHGEASTIGEERRSNPFLRPGADHFF